MPGFVEVKNSRELQATLYAIQLAPATIRKDLRAQTRAVMAREWTRELQRRPATVQQSRLLVNTARITVRDTNVVMRSAGSKRRVSSGGLVPVDDGRAFEFGAGRAKVTTYQGRRGSKRFTVRRHTARQMPTVRKAGYIVYPAFAEVAPRAISLWMQTTMRVIAHALEGDTS